jgi:hypothetical protein
MKNLLILLTLTIAFSLWGIDGATAQSITITSTIASDTVGIPADMHASLDHRIEITVSSATATSHFRVGMGMEEGDETLLSREFSTSETGTFNDGCSLQSSGGNLNIGLGTYSGLEDFTVTVTPILGDGSDGVQTYNSY